MQFEASRIICMEVHRCLSNMPVQVTPRYATVKGFNLPGRLKHLDLMK